MPAPLLQKYLSLPPDERGARLAEQFRRLLSDAWGAPAEAIPLRKPFFALRPGGSDPLAAYLILRTWTRDALGLHFYPVEMRSHRNLEALARYLAAELSPPDWEAEPVVEEIYEGGNWAWGDPPGAEREALPHPALLVLSTPRAGSTLFRAMLAGHPQLFSPPELNLLPFTEMASRRRLADRLGYEWIRSGPATAFGELDGTGQGGGEERCVQLEHETAPIPEVYRLLCEAAAPRILVDKSPLYAAHPDWIRRAESLFAEPRYIHLIRHPMAVMESFARMRFHRLLGPHWRCWDDNPWRLGEKVWVSFNEAIEEALSAADPGRCIVVRFEVLVANPESEARRLCAFLGLEFDRGMLEPYAAGRMVRRSVGSGLPETPTIGDPNLLQRTGIDAGLADRWRDSPMRRLPGRALSQAAQRYGYAL